jgi:hypothetical protein
MCTGSLELPCVVFISISKLLKYLDIEGNSDNKRPEGVKIPTCRYFSLLRLDLL